MKVIITQIPRWNYFMYFLLGFYELQAKKNIKIKFKTNLIVKIASKTNSKKLSKVLRILYSKLFKKGDLYNLKGYIVLDNGKKKKFVLDSADSPYLFNSKDLEECDVYFKMQCPKQLDSEGFELAPNIIIPWTDHIKEKNKNSRRICNNFKRNKNKIKPLMIGTRNLSEGISYKLLKEGFNNYLESRNIEKNKKLMCYFGNSKGPVPKIVSKDELDVDREAQIVGYYGERINHPNEKRAKAAEIISNIEPKDLYDARVINLGNFGIKSSNNKKNLVIPIEKFCDHIAQFQYNLNISGYRKSIPNRFTESFISGTGIVTDELAIKWYKPFDNEVVETVPMGYLKDKDVDWKKFEEDIRSLPKVSKEEVIDAFEKKWSPTAVCNYMIEELLKV